MSLFSWISDAVSDTKEFFSDLGTQIGASIKSITADDDAIEAVKDTAPAQQLKQKHNIDLGSAKDGFFKVDWFDTTPDLDEKLQKVTQAPEFQSIMQTTFDAANKASNPEDPFSTKDFTDTIQNANTSMGTLLTNYGIPVNAKSWNYEDTQALFNVAQQLGQKNAAAIGVDPSTGKLRGLSQKAQDEIVSSQQSADAANKDFKAFMRTQYADGIKEDKFTIYDTLVNRNTYLQMEDNLSSYYADNISSFDTMISNLEKNKAKVDPSNLESYQSDIDKIKTYKDQFAAGFKETIPFIIQHKDIDQANEAYKAKYGRDISDALSVEFGEYAPNTVKAANLISAGVVGGAAAIAGAGTMGIGTAAVLGGVASTGIGNSETAIGKTKMTLFDAANQIQQDAVTKRTASSFSDYLQEGIAWISRATAPISNTIFGLQESIAGKVGISNELSKVNLSDLKNEIETGQLSDESSQLRRFGRKALDISPYVLDLVLDPINLIGGALPKAVSKVDDVVDLAKGVSRIDAITDVSSLSKYMRGLSLSEDQLKLIEKAASLEDAKDIAKSSLPQVSSLTNDLADAAKVIDTSTPNISKSPFTQSEEALELLKNGGALTIDGRKFVIDTLYKNPSTLARQVAYSTMDLLYETVYMDGKMQNYMSAEYTPMDAALSFGTEIIGVGIKALRRMNILSSNYMADMRQFVNNPTFQKEFITQLISKTDPKVADQFRKFLDTADGAKETASITKAMVKSVDPLLNNVQAAAIAGKKGGLNDKEVEYLKETIKRLQDPKNRDIFTPELQLILKNKQNGMKPFTIPGIKKGNPEITFDPSTNTFRKGQELLKIQKFKKSNIQTGESQIVKSSTGDYLTFYGSKDPVTGPAISSGNLGEGKFELYKLLGDDEGYILRATYSDDPDLRPGELGTKEIEDFFLLGNWNDEIDVEPLNSKNFSKEFKGLDQRIVFLDKSENAMPKVEEFKEMFIKDITANYPDIIKSYKADFLNELYDTIYNTVKNIYDDGKNEFNQFNPGNHAGVITGSFIMDLMDNKGLLDGFNLITDAFGEKSDVIKIFTQAKMYQDPVLGVLFEKRIREFYDKPIIPENYRTVDDLGDVVINKRAVFDQVITQIKSDPAFKIPDEYNVVMSSRDKSSFFHNTILKKLESDDKFKETIKQLKKDAKEKELHPENTIYRLRENKELGTDISSEIQKLYDFESDSSSLYNAWTENKLTSKDLSAEITRLYNLEVNAIKAQEDFDGFGALLNYDFQTSYINNVDKMMKKMGYENISQDAIASYFEYIGVRNLSNIIKFNYAFEKNQIQESINFARKEFQGILKSIRDRYPDQAETVGSYQVASVVARTKQEYSIQIQDIKTYIASVKGNSEEFDIKKFLDIYQSFYRRSYQQAGELSDKDFGVLSDFTNLFSGLEKQFNAIIKGDQSATKLKNKIVKEIESINVQDLVNDLVDNMIDAAFKGNTSPISIKGSTLGSMFVINFGNILARNAVDGISVGEVIAEEGLHLLQHHLNILNYNFDFKGSEGFVQKLQYLGDDAWPLFQDSINLGLQSATSDIQKIGIIQRAYKEIEADYVRAFFGPEYQKDWAVEKFANAKEWIKNRYLSMHMKLEPSTVKAMDNIFKNRDAKLAESIAKIKEHQTLEFFSSRNVSDNIFEDIKDQSQIDKSYARVIDELTEKLIQNNGKDFIFRNVLIAKQGEVSGNSLEQKVKAQKIALNIITKQSNLIAKLDPQEAYHILSQVLKQEGILSKYESFDLAVIKQFKEYIENGNGTVEEGMEVLQNFLKVVTDKTADDLSVAEMRRLVLDNFDYIDDNDIDVETLYRQINSRGTSESKLNLSESYADFVPGFIKKIQRDNAEYSLDKGNFVKGQVMDYILNRKYYKDGYKIGAESVDKFFTEAKEFVVLTYTAKNIEDKNIGYLINYYNKLGNVVSVPGMNVKTVDVSGLKSKQIREIINSSGDGSVIFAPAGLVGKKKINNNGIKLFTGDEFPGIHFGSNDKGDLQLSFTSTSIFDSFIQDIRLPSDLYVKDLLSDTKELKIAKWKDEYARFLKLQKIENIDEQQDLIQKLTEEQILTLDYMTNNMLESGTPFIVGLDTPVYGQILSEILSKKQLTKEQVKKRYHGTAKILLGDDIPENPDSFYDDLFSYRSQFKIDLYDAFFTKQDEIRLFQNQNNFIKKYFEQGEIDGSINISEINFGVGSIYEEGRKITPQTTIQTLMMSDNFKLVKGINIENVIAFSKGIQKEGTNRAYTKEESAILAKLYVANKEFFGKTKYERLDELAGKEINEQVDELTQVIAQSSEDRLEMFKNESGSTGFEVIPDENKIWYDDVSDYLVELLDRSDKLLDGSDTSPRLYTGAFDQRFMGMVSANRKIEFEATKHNFVKKAFSNFIAFDNIKFSETIKKYSGFVENNKKVMQKISKEIFIPKELNTLTDQEMIKAYYPLWSKMNTLYYNTLGRSLKPLNISSRQLSRSDFIDTINNWVSSVETQYNELLNNKISYLGKDNIAGSISQNLLGGKGYIEIPNIVKYNGTKILGFQRLTTQDFGKVLLSQIKKQTLGITKAKEYLIGFGQLKYQSLPNDIDRVMKELNNPRLTVYDAQGIVKQVLEQWYFETDLSRKLQKRKNVITFDELNNIDTDTIQWNMEGFERFQNMVGMEVPEKFYNIVKGLVGYLGYGGNDMARANTSNFLTKYMAGSLYEKMLLNTDIGNKASRTEKYLEQVVFELEQYSDLKVFIINRTKEKVPDIEFDTLYNKDTSFYQSVDKVFDDYISSSKYQLQSEITRTKLLGDLDEHIYDIIGYKVKEKLLDLNEKQDYDVFSSFAASENGKNFGDNALFAAAGGTVEELYSKLKINIDGGEELSLGKVDKKGYTKVLINAEVNNNIRKALVERFNIEYQIKYEEMIQKYDGESYQADGGYFEKLLSDNQRKILLDAGFEKQKKVLNEKVLDMKDIVNSSNQKLEEYQLDRWSSRSIKSSYLPIAYGKSAKVGNVVEFDGRRYVIESIDVTKNIQKNLGDYGLDEKSQIFLTNVDVKNYPNTAKISEYIEEASNKPLTALQKERNSLLIELVKLNDLFRRTIKEEAGRIKGIESNNKEIKVVSNKSIKEIEFLKTEQNDILKNIILLKKSLEKQIEKQANKKNQDLIEEIDSGVKAIQDEIKIQTDLLLDVNKKIKNFGNIQTKFVNNSLTDIDYTGEAKELSDKITNIKSSLLEVNQRIKDGFDKKIPEDMLDTLRPIGDYDYDKDMKAAIKEEVKNYIIWNSKKIINDFADEFNKGYVAIKTIYPNGALDSGGMEIGIRVVEERVPTSQKIRGLDVGIVKRSESINSKNETEIKKEVLQRFRPGYKLGESQEQLVDKELNKVDDMSIDEYRQIVKARSLLEDYLKQKGKNKEDLLSNLKTILKNNGDLFTDSITKLVSKLSIENKQQNIVKVQPSTLDSDIKYIERKTLNTTNENLILNDINLIQNALKEIGYAEQQYKKVMDINTDYQIIKVQTKKEVPYRKVEYTVVGDTVTLKKEIDVIDQTNMISKERVGIGSSKIANLGCNI